MDWKDWHDGYDQPGSTLSRRLTTVQDLIRRALDACPPGPVRVVSMCAGQGRDLLGTLPSHPRRDDVTARLVELDPRIAAVAAAGAAALPSVSVVTGDAALTDAYADMVPADLVLVCGVFGNIVAADIERTIDTCTRLCAPAGRVIWTRHRHEPDLVPRICEWFVERGFTPEWLSDPSALQGIGMHRFDGTPRPFQPGVRMFGFAGYEALRGEAT